MTSQALVSHESNQFGFAGTVFRSTTQTKPLNIFYQQVSTSSAILLPSIRSGLDTADPTAAVSASSQAALPDSQQNVRPEVQLLQARIRSPPPDQVSISTDAADVADINHFLSTSISDHREVSYPDIVVCPQAGKRSISRAPDLPILKAVIINPQPRRVGFDDKWRFQPV